jgi:hypothetical protein
VNGGGGGCPTVDNYFNNVSPNGGDPALVVNNNDFASRPTSLSLALLSCSVPRWLASARFASAPTARSPIE